MASKRLHFPAGCPLPDLDRGVSASRRNQPIIRTERYDFDWAAVSAKSKAFAAGGYIPKFDGSVIAAGRQHVGIATNRE